MAMLPVFSGCTSWVGEHQSVNAATDLPASIRVTREDGSRLTIDGPHVDSDSLRGFHRQLRRPVAIDTSSIQWISIQKVDRFKTGLAAFGGLLSAGFMMLILNSVEGWGDEKL
jgi:hypothetical protein